VSQQVAPRTVEPGALRRFRRSPMNLPEPGWDGHRHAPQQSISTFVARAEASTQR
jgi:hypothetical protein